MGKVNESGDNLEISTSFELPNFLESNTIANKQSIEIWSELINKVNEGTSIIGWYTVVDDKANIKDEWNFNENVFIIINL